MKCPLCRDRRRQECPACDGTGLIEATITALLKTPPVDVMETDRCYLNYNSVYLRPLSVVTTTNGPYAAIERFYRPRRRALVEESARIYHVANFQLPTSWAPGQSWSDVVLQSLASRCLAPPRYNRTWEIPLEDWLTAYNNPKIWL